jgi:hypothetical protein
MKKPLMLLSSLFVAVSLFADLKVTSIDTPNLLSDPASFTESVEKLNVQKKWTDFATKEEIALFDGPMHEWPTVDASQYNMDGFDKTMLGSSLPPVGVHPRVLFSLEDLPWIRKRLQSTENGKIALWYTQYVLDRTLYNPESDEGKQYQLLATGNLSNLKWNPKEFCSEGKKGKIITIFDGYKPSWKYNIHTGYISQLFSGAALLCHFDKNEKRGKELAAVIANYWKLREEIIEDVINNGQRYQLLAGDEWRGIHQFLGNNALWENYDLAAKWMTTEQKKNMRSIISKCTKGRRGYGANGPARWFTTNWHTWDFAHVLTALSIEGEEGYDPEILKNATPLARAFLDWGINKNGLIFEPNGKIGAGLKGQIMMMVAMSRREINQDLWGHPHLRKLPEAQVQIVAPHGMQSFSNGTWANKSFGGSANLLKSFYPKDKAIDWLCRQSDPEQNERTLESFKEKILSKKLNWKSGSAAGNFLTITSLGFADIYNYSNWDGFKDKKGELLPSWDRTPLQLSNTFIDDVAGLVTTRNSDEKDAIFMHFDARKDYIHVGHQAHSAGHFYLSANSKLWSVVADPKGKMSRVFSSPRIDGEGFGLSAGFGNKVDYLGTVDGDILTISSADLKNAWDYDWAGPFRGDWRETAFVPEYEISVETNPEVVKFFKGTQHYKIRLWDHSYYSTNWGPTMRIKSRPVEYAYRSAGIIKGKNSYALIIDDLKMDDELRSYEWIMQLPLAVRAMDYPKLPANQVILRYETAETIREVNLESRNFYTERPKRVYALNVFVSCVSKMKIWVLGCIS